MSNLRRAKGHGQIIEVIPEKKYRIRVGCGFKADGKPRQKQETVNGTRAYAEWRAEQIYAELSNDVVVNSGYTLEQYYQNVVVTSRESTTKANQKALRTAWLHVPESWKRAELHEPSQTELQAWVDTMTAPTARSAVKYLRSILRQAYGDGLLARVPMTEHLRYRRESASDKDSVVWDEEEAALVLLTVRGLNIEPYILVALGAGLRREEAMALDWEDIEHIGDVAWITINKTMTEADGLTDKTKTETSARRVPVVGYVAARLKEIHATGHLMTGKKGALSIGGLMRRWRNLWRAGGRVRRNVVRPDGALFAAGVTRIPPNRLRHTHNSLMSEAGVDPTTSEIYHGHAPSSIEAKHYIKRNDQRLLSAARACAERLDAWIKYVDAGLVH